MPFQSYTPEGPLSQFVSTIWWMSNAGVPSSRQRVCPNGGAMQLVLNLADRNLSFFDGAKCQSVRAPLIAGPYSKAFSIDPAEFTAVIGVQFKPGAARLILRLPAHELHNTDVPFEDLYPEEGVRLRDALLSATGLAGRFRVLESYLLEKLCAATPLHPAVDHALLEFTRRPSLRAVADVQAETGISHTRFLQVFKEQVGLTPKLFCRLQRFRNVLQRVENGRPVRWAEIAADCGYFDQAHLIHDFRAFSGMTPLEYAAFQQRSESDSVKAGGAG